MMAEASPTVESEDENSFVSDCEDEAWWSWAERGRGCDAEAFTERFAGWSGSAVP